MKLLRNDIIMWWRGGLIAGGVVLAGFAFFSSLLYQKIITIANEPVSFLEEEHPVLFSPALLDDIKAFWERRGPIQKCPVCDTEDTSSDTEKEDTSSEDETPQE